MEKLPSNTVSSNPDPPDQRSGLQSASSAPRPPHLRRLAHVWIKYPVYFVTTCTHGRAPLFATDTAHAILCAEWQAADSRHGW